MDMSPVVPSHPHSVTIAPEEEEKPRSGSGAVRAKKRWTKAVKRVTIINVATRREKRACCSCCICFRDPKDKDSGIPPICLKYQNCPFNPNNRYLAKSKLARMFSNIGYTFFDKYRRVFLGLAFIWTLVGFFVTCIACLALFNDEIILRTVHWAGGATYEGILPPKGFNYSAIFIGLRGYNYVSCWNTSKPIQTGIDAEGEPNWALSADVYGTGNDFECFSDVYPWDYNAADEGINQDWAGKCAYSCAATIFTAVSSCAPMIFAMVGALNRMNKHSDAPQQKMLGAITDTIGAVTLCLALLSFERGCFDDMKREKVNFQYEKWGEKENLEFERIWWGRGSAYWIFWIFCFTGSCLRALIHWLTPCPGLGLGFFTWRLPTGEEMSSQLVSTARRAKEKGKRVGHRVRAKVKESVIQPAGRTFARGVSSLERECKGESGSSVGSVGSETIEEGEESEDDDKFFNDSSVEMGSVEGSVIEEEEEEEEVVGERKDTKV
ncbi:hypothetical protein TrLO_g588 [Triparma laevis f. longispina]|uniref:Uncharacterized protein n=1 Tax=Triparma laevis f. longispina TaxID=1714387 RepID=A0A9W7A488_9STRA|nr:hypothetical protein TrLO_g588 [Triparma laevis f. longispina]